MGFSRDGIGSATDIAEQRSPGLGRFSERVKGVGISDMSRKRNAKVRLRWEFALFRRTIWVQTEHGTCCVLSSAIPNHSGGQLKLFGCVLNLALID